MHNKNDQVYLYPIRYKKIFFMQKKIRHIKLQPRHRKLSLGDEQIVPSLLLSGIWLEEMGFKTGEQVTITVKKNQLIIKK